MNTKDMVLGTNRFFFYAMNYPCIRIDYKSIDGTYKYDYLPDFFKSFPSHLIEHLKGKWNYACEQYGGYGAMMKFYGELDSTHRKEMLTYIMENYDDEQKIRFEE